MNGPTPSTAPYQPDALRARLQEILSAPEDDVLGRLFGAGLVSPPDTLQPFDVTPDATPSFDRADGPSALAPVPGSIGRVDPRQSRATLAGGRTLGMYVQDCLINTEADPPYHRLPSFSSHNPYHIVYLLGFGANEPHTVILALQVFSAGGTVRITTTGNSNAIVLGQSSTPITISATLTTTAEGFASVFIQRAGETGFDWFAMDVL